MTISSFQNMPFTRNGIISGLEVSAEKDKGILKITKGKALLSDGEEVKIISFNNGDWIELHPNADSNGGDNTEKTEVTNGSFEFKTQEHVVNGNTVPAEKNGKYYLAIAILPGDVIWLKLTSAQDHSSLVILAEIELHQGCVTDMSYKNRRYYIDISTESVAFQGSSLSGTKTLEVNNVEAGEISPLASGSGLQITVPNSSDNVSIAKVTIEDFSEKRENFSTMEVRANTVVAKDTAGRDALSLKTSESALIVGTKGNAGDLSVKDGSGKNILRAFETHGAGVRVDIGDDKKGRDGTLSVKDGAGRDTFTAYGNSAYVAIGATKDNPGNLVVRDSGGSESVKIEGDRGKFSAKRIGPSGHTTSLDIDAKYLRVHGWDLCLDGRSRGNKRALVDNKNRLVINWEEDYVDGVETHGDFKVGGNAVLDKQLKVGDNVVLDKQLKVGGNIVLVGQLKDEQGNISLTHEQQQKLTTQRICSLHKHDIGIIGRHPTKVGTRIGVISGMVRIQAAEVSSELIGKVSINFNDHTFNKMSSSFIENDSVIHGYKGKFTDTPHAILSPVRILLSTHHRTLFDIWYYISPSEITINWRLDTYYDPNSNIVQFLIVGPIST